MSLKRWEWEQPHPTCRDKTKGFRPDVVLKTGLNSQFLGVCLFKLLDIPLSIFPLSICIWSLKKRMQRRKITGGVQQWKLGFAEVFIQKIKHRLPHGSEQQSALDSMGKRLERGWRNDGEVHG